MIEGLPIPERDRSGAPVEPTWHMRQRIAAAMMCEPLPIEHCYGRFLHEPAEQRARLELKADWLLLALDKLGLVIEERGEQ